MRVKGSTRIKMSLLPGSEKVQVIVSEDKTSPIQIFHQRRSVFLILLKVSVDIFLRIISFPFLPYLF